MLPHQKLLFKHFHFKEILSPNKLKRNWDVVKSEPFLLVSSFIIFHWYWAIFIWPPGVSHGPDTSLSSPSAWDHVAISDITEEICRPWRGEPRPLVPGHVGLGAGEEPHQPRARPGDRGQADQLLRLPEDLGLPAPDDPRPGHQVGAPALPPSAR